MKGGECRIGGKVLSIASDTHGKTLWAGNDKVIAIIINVRFESL